MSEQNGVTRRVDRLTRSWLRFSEEPAQRVLRWRLGTDAARMLDCFLAFHNEEESDLTDLFLPVVVEAHDPEEYWTNVLRELLCEFEDARPDLMALELPVDWQPPEFPTGTPSAQQLVTALASYQEFYSDLFEHAVVVLLPTEIASRDAWLECMEALMRVTNWPPAVRIIVPDWLPETILQDWSVEHSAYVHTESPRLDMPGLPLELLAHLPGTGPAFEFRRLFVQLGAAASTGQATLATQFAERALRIATNEGWYALAAAVQLMAGSLAMGQGESQQVLSAYRSARHLASQIDDPTGPKVAITSALAEASALLAGGEFEQARDVYRQAAQQADAAEDTFSSLEARRMASYCSEASGDFDAAWREGQQALQAARNLDDDARANSTLPALLLRLEEMARRPGLDTRQFNLDQQCSELLGNEWNQVMSHTRSLLS